MDRPNVVQFLLNFRENSYQIKVDRFSPETVKYSQKVTIWIKFQFYKEWSKMEEFYFDQTQNQVN